MKKLNWRLTSMFTLVGALAATTASNAAGFALRETSASFIGTSLAGAGSAKDDVTAMWNNPATLTSMKKLRHAAFSGNVIFPSAKFSTSQATFFNGAAISGTNGGDAGSAAFIPAGYLMYSANDALKFGVSVTVPWGLKTEYNPNWVGRYRAIRSEIQSVNINPVAAYRVNQWLSVAGGIQAQYMKAKLSKMIDTGGAAPGARDVFVDVQADDWSWGGNLGFTVDFTPATKMGLSYRSHISHKLEGRVVANPSLGLVAVPTSGDTARGNLQTPETINLSVTHEFNPEWAIMSDVIWTHWSRLRELRLSFTRQAQGLGAGPSDSVENLNWKDAWFASVGGTYKPNQLKDWKFSAGIAVDQSPTRGATRSPRLPDTDRLWLSCGIAYSPTAWVDLNLSYAHVFAKDGGINLRSSGVVGVAPSDTLRGSFKNKVDIIGLQAKFKF